MDNPFAFSEQRAGHGVLGAPLDIPPYSTLDARQGPWQERKQAWIALGIRSELGRDAEAFACGGAGDLVARYNVTPPGKRRRQMTQEEGLKILADKVPRTIPTAVVRVVMAVPTKYLDSGTKLVWLVHRDQAYQRARRREEFVASAAEVGEYVGMGSRNVDKARRLLVEAGLLNSSGPRGQRGYSWWATFPLPYDWQLDPKKNPEAKAESARLAVALGEHVRHARARLKRLPASRKRTVS